MRNLKALMAETVSGSTVIMTIMPRFLSTPPHPHPKAVNSMQFTTFTHLSKVPPHEYGGYKISFHRRNENSETTKTEARWRDRGGGGKKWLWKPHFHHRAPLTTQITFHFYSCGVPQVSLPTGRSSMQSLIVSLAPNLWKGEGPRLAGSATKKKNLL